MEDEKLKEYRESNMKIEKLIPSAWVLVVIAWIMRLVLVGHW